MDTTHLRMIAAGANLIGDYKPTHYTTLVDPRGPRVLMSDGQHSYVLTLASGAQALNAEAEKLAAAVLRGVLPPDAGFQLPVTVASKAFNAHELTADEATLIVSEPLPGLPLSTQAFGTEPELIDSLAGVLASLHNAEVGAVADAGLVTLEPQEVREGYLELLDSGAQTGKIPQVLLQRWETLLETPSVWHFLPTIVHDSVSVDAIRIDAGEVVALNDLHSVRVGDPAVDIAAALDLLSPEDYERFIQAYGQARRADDPHLDERVELTNELEVLKYFLATVESGDEDAQADAQAMLQALTAGLESDPAAAEASVSAPETADSAADSAEPDVHRSSETQGIDADAQGFRPSAPVNDSPDDDAEPTDVISR